MTLDELLHQLAALRQALPGDTLIVQAKDSEGNAFSPTAEAEVAMYAATSTRSGERYLTREGRLSRENPGYHSEAPDTAVSAVFLWPTN